MEPTRTQNSSANGPVCSSGAFLGGKAAFAFVVFALKTLIEPCLSLSSQLSHARVLPNVGRRNDAAARGLRPAGSAAADLDAILVLRLFSSSARSRTAGTLALTRVPVGFPGFPGLTAPPLTTRMDVGDTESKLDVSLKGFHLRSHLSQR